MPPRQYQVQKETAPVRHFDSNHNNDDHHVDGNSSCRMLSNQRHLSRNNEHTSTRTTSTHLTVGTLLRRREVEEFLNAPIGSLTPTSWMKAERLADRLGGRGGTQSIIKAGGGGKSDNENDDFHALLLLERLGREPDSNVRLSNETVHSIVSNWKNNLNRSKSSNNDNSIRSPTASEKIFVRPSIVWKTILDLDRRGVQLESSVFNKIVEGTQHVSSDLTSPTDGPFLAEKILNWMMDGSKDNPLIRPDALTFEHVIGSWGTVATSGNNSLSKEAPERSLALLRKLKTLYDSGWGQELMPTRSIYRRVMLCYAHQGDGDMVESLLEELYTFYLDQIEKFPHLRLDLELELAPSTPCFSLVLYAWSKSNDSSAADRSEMILEWMLDLESTGELQNLFVPAKCFNLVMIAWGRKRLPESPLKCQALFDRMLQLSNDENLGRNKQRGSAQALDTISRSKAPTGGSYLTLITTWVRFDSTKAEDIFMQWKKEHSLGNVDMRVDSSLFQTIVMAVCDSNAPDSAKICDRWIQLAIEDDIISPCKLDALVFSTTINAWCQTKTREGIIRAEELLCLLRDRHKCFFLSDNKAAPTVHCYLPIVQGWAETFGNVEKAEQLVLEWMSLDPSMKQRQNRRRRGVRRSMDKKGGQTKLFFPDDNELDTRLFNICIKGWMKVTPRDPSAPYRAENLLLSMEKFGIKPNAASFKYVLNAWRDRGQRQIRRWTIGMNNQKPPRAHEVVSLLDRMFQQGALGVPNESYLSLRQGLHLLAVE